METLNQNFINGIIELLTQTECRNSPGTLFYLPPQAQAICSKMNVLKIDFDGDVRATRDFLIASLTVAVYSNKEEYTETGTTQEATQIIAACTNILDVCLELVTATKMSDEEVDALYTECPSLDDPYYDGLDYLKTVLYAHNAHHGAITFKVVVDGQVYFVESDPSTGDTWYRK